MEFIKRLFKGEPATGDSPAEEGEHVPGAAPVQTQEELDTARARMEAEMATQREDREATEESEDKA